MRVVVTGGAGFLGSHLCAALLARGDRVICVDNLCTGRYRNVAALRGPRFTFIDDDISRSLYAPGPVDAVAHLASPASPPDYLRLPLETLAAGSRGTERALGIARKHDARFILASTSEVYGDPQVHPQTEGYWGNVNPTGPRSVYDEAKRYAEATTSAYRRACGVNTGIARIFNTYGPHLRPNDGRVVSTFITQALAGDPLTVYGDGTQTRSLCYVDDTVRGLLALLDSDDPGPVNIGNPDEYTVRGIADLILAATGSRSPVVHRPLPEDDPTRRRPDITLAGTLLGWKPEIDLVDGIARTVAWFRGVP